MVKTSSIHMQAFTRTSQALSGRSNTVEAPRAGFILSEGEEPFVQRMCLGSLNARDEQKHGFLKVEVWRVVEREGVCLL